MEHERIDNVAFAPALRGQGLVLVEESAQIANFEAGMVRYLG